MINSLSTNQWHQAFLVLMADKPIEGLHADFSYYEQDGFFIPVSYSKPMKDNCYAVSLLTLITGYAEDELVKIKHRGVRFICLNLIHVLKPILSYAGLNDIQTLNNQCLSTNMYDENWHRVDVSELRRQALKQAPQMPLILRSLNEQQHGSIIRQLQQDGWIALVTRQVYLHMHWHEFSMSKDFKKDLKLMEEEGWQYKSLSTPEEFELAIKYYNMLYLEKYSIHSIRFTADYIKQASKIGLLKLFGVFYQGEMLATCGIVTMGREMTCPVIGYDTTKPQKYNLYRRVSIYTLRYAWENRLNFNMSAGAPSFKTNRGARASIEYSYLYIQHLPLLQRMVWRTLTNLARLVYLPLLKHYKL